MNRYSNIDFVLNLDWCEGVELIYEAEKQKYKQKLWDMYLLEFQYMTSENRINFDEYCEMAYEKSEKPVISNKSKDEILEEVEEILKMFKERESV